MSVNLPPTTWVDLKNLYNNSYTTTGITGTAQCFPTGTGQWKQLGSMPYSTREAIVNRILMENKCDFSWYDYAKLCAKQGIPAHPDVTATVTDKEVEEFIESRMRKALDEAKWYNHYKNLKGLLNL